MTTIDELQQAMREFEDRENCDFLIVSLFSDGSGHVLAPEPIPDGHPETPESCHEQVFDFENIGQLGEYLSAGHLPETESDPKQKEEVKQP